MRSIKIKKPFTVKYKKRNSYVTIPYYQLETIVRRIIFDDGFMRELKKSVRR